MFYSCNVNYWSLLLSLSLSLSLLTSLTKAKPDYVPEMAVSTAFHTRWKHMDAFVSIEETGG
jgi:hypothetical protein